MNPKVLKKNIAIEKEVFDALSPFLDMPPTSINGQTNPIGKSTYIRTRRIIQEAVKDPAFVRAFQQRKVTIRDMLFHVFPDDVVPKLLKAEMRHLVPYESEKKTKGTA